MATLSSVPFIYVKEVWSNHTTEFYEREAKWLLDNLGGRLRKQSFRQHEDLAAALLHYLFTTDWFRSVKLGRGEVIILQRKRGEIFFVIRLQDITAIRKRAQKTVQNNRHKALASV